MKTVALEGSSFSGKSTLAQQLGEHFKAPVIGEYIDYALRIDPAGFPPFATTKEELEEQIEFYASLEARRQQDINALADDLVVVDRTAASLVAFQRAQQEHTRDDATHWDPEKMERRLKMSQTLGQLVVPEVVLVLSAGSQAEHDARVQKRGAIAIDHLRQLNQWSFSEALRQHTITSLGSMFPSTPTIEYVNDNPNTLEEIIGNIKDITGVQA